MADDENSAQKPPLDIEEELVDVTTEMHDNAIVDTPRGTTKKSFGQKIKSLPATYWAKKKWTLPVTFLVVVAVILAVPFTRYAVLGLFMKGTVEVSVLDSKSNTPVSGATVSMGGETFKTDAAGKAKGEVKLGSSMLKVTKQYYSDTSQDVTVTLSADKNKFSVPLSATGRQVPVTVINNITQKPLANAEIIVLDTTAKTNKDGRATIVLPTRAATQKGTVRLRGYNSSEVTIKVTDKVDPGNEFKLTPSGKLYFLSNQSGKIDVVKTDLDGKNREVVLAGTGKEEAYTTSLLASRDWKYLALLSNRTGNGASVYLINTTAGDKLTTVDEGKAIFGLYGWSDNTLVYMVDRQNVQNWQPKRQALKSYNAATGKLTTIDETAGEGNTPNDYAHTRFSDVYILNNELVYSQYWSASAYALDGKSVNFVSVKPDGTGKKTIKAFPVPANQSYYSINSVLYAPYGIYLQAPTATASTYYAYEAGIIKQRNDVSENTFYQRYPTFLISPSGDKTFWAELRDGKNALFIGGKNAEDKKQIVSSSELNPYGWYSDEYLLLSQKGSELYVLPISGDTKAQKITDYYRPDVNYYGYGGGYGGL
jgi:hypothetical protein